MTSQTSTVCATVVKLACLGGLFALAWVYDGAMLYVFAAVTGGVLGYDIAKVFPSRSSK